MKTKTKVKLNMGYFYYFVIYLSVAWVWEANCFSLDNIVYKTRATRNFLNNIFKSEAYMKTDQLIRKYNYPLETHTVETEDGYSLTLFRIPVGKHGLERNAKLGRVPVILQHGFVASSDIFLLLGNKSLPYMLSDEGYDVWLTNSRDTRYSSHKTYTKKELKYWDYSYDEIGKYDVPAFINYILRTTGESQVTWIGHSMGTTMFFVAMDVHPQLQKHVKNAVLLAPVAILCNMKSPVVLLENFSTQQLELAFNFVGGGRAYPVWLRNFINKVGPRICVRSFARSCWNFYAYIGGPNPKQFDQDIIRKAIGHVPMDSASRITVQYVQSLSNNCEFRKYDFGANENLIRYGDRKPPTYNLSSIAVPTHALYGANDWLSVPKDAAKTVLQLQNVLNFTQVEDPLFAHFDFVFAKDAPKLVNEVVIDFLSK